MVKKKLPSDPRVMDAYDIGYARKYRELNRWRRTVVPWIGLSVCVAGLITLFIAYATYDKPHGPWEFKSPNGMAAELSADSSRIVINDIVFIAPDAEDSTPAYYDALVIIALCFVLGGILAMLLYFGWHIVEKSKEAGWEMVEQLHGKEESK